MMYVHSPSSVKSSSSTSARMTASYADISFSTLDTSLIDWTMYDIWPSDGASLRLISLTASRFDQAVQ